MRIVLTILILFLTSCIRGSFKPYIVNYTIQEQQELERVLTKENNPVLNKFIIDYYNLRRELE